MGPRPGADKVCLVCSFRTGQLVEYRCPVLDRQREAHKVRTEARVKRKAELASERYMIGDVDLRKVLADVWRVATRIEPNLPTPVPELVVEYRNSCTLGTASWFRYQIRLNRGSKDCSRGVRGVTRTLIHEVAHFVNHYRGGHGHDDWFKSAWAELRHECADIMEEVSR